MNKFYSKLIDLIEKEIEFFDRRPTKERGTHPEGSCMMNSIISLVEKELKCKHRYAKKQLKEVPGLVGTMCQECNERLHIDYRKKLDFKKNVSI